MTQRENTEREEKLAGEDIVIRNPIFLWFENVWYHHKWTIILVAFFLFVAIVCFAQCATTPHKDIYITFGGSYTMTSEEHQSVERVFAELSKSTFSEGAPAVGVVSYPFYTEAELRALFTDPETGVGDGQHDRCTVCNTRAFQQIGAGETAIAQ